MSDRLQTQSANNGQLSHLRAAYDRARSLKQAATIPDQHIPENIRQHRHVPILAPKGPMRTEPDIESFLAREARDRQTALNRNRTLQNQPQLDKPNTGLEI